MDIRLRIGSIYSHHLWNSPRNQTIVKPSCSRGSSPQPNGENNGSKVEFIAQIFRRAGGVTNGNRFPPVIRDKFSTDWDKAWSKFRKQGKKTLFSNFSPNKYVTWNPRRSEFPLSEEVDPIKRTERSNLSLWTSPAFTLVGAIVVVTFLLVYTILAPVK